MNRIEENNRTKQDDNDLNNHLLSSFGGRALKRKGFSFSRENSGNTYIVIQRNSFLDEILSGMGHGCVWFLVD